MSLKKYHIITYKFGNGNIFGMIYKKPAGIKLVFLLMLFGHLSENYADLHFTHLTTDMQGNMLHKGISLFVAVIIDNNDTIFLSVCMP
jgi:hypothetical protein